MKTLNRILKKTIDKIIEVAKILFTGVFGKILIVPIAVGYYFTNNIFLQLLEMSILFYCIRFNYHGFQFRTAKSKLKYCNDKVIYINSLAK